MDNDFHLGIARASRNDWLAKATLAARIEMFRPVGSIFERLEPQANHLHEQIVTAIADKDGDGAARWMSEHIGETLASIESWLQPRGRARREPTAGRATRPGRSPGAGGLPAGPSLEWRRCAAPGCTSLLPEPFTLRRPASVPEESRRVVYVVTVRAGAASSKLR